jgi:hypothetical protein
MSTKETPADVSAEVLAMQPAWELIAALMGGTKTMREAGKTLLPKAPAESEEAYQERRRVSTLYGAYRRTVETMASRPFSEAIKLGEDVPAAMLPYLDDVDLEGRDFQSFALGVFQTALADGLSHILVEFPTVDPKKVKTLADEKAIAARPYFVHINPRNVLGWRAERVAGAMTLTMFRFMERITEPAGQWGTTTVDQVRVLERTKWSTYRKSADTGNWELHEEGPVTIGCIPLATVYTGRTGFLTACPPLLPLAYLNVEHWQSASDQQNILHVARVPILFASGFGDGALTVGAASAISNDDPASRLAYVEHSGAAIESGRQSLLDLEERMASLGAELLVSDPSAAAAQTATKTNADVAEQTSALAAMVNDLEDSLKRALGFMAKWASLGDNGGTVELEGNFTSMDPLDVASLISAKEKGILSAETVFLEFQRAGLIDEELTWEDEKARLALDAAVATEKLKADTEASTLPADPAAPGGSEGGAGGSPAGGGAASAQAPDFGPLLASIEKLINRPEPEPPQAAEPIDLKGLVDAIKAIPAPVVNVPAPDNGMVAAVLAMADAMKNAPAPQFTIESPSVTVEPAQVTVEAPAAPTITMPPINVTIEKSSGKVTFTEDADGQITGAKLN